ncbi:MAG TPA: protein kinase [Gemmataceae bacterium]|nr:protein kinase [Gemmataceae bacterium]
MTGPDVRPPADLELDAYLEPFEAAAARGEAPDPGDYLPPPNHPKYAAVLAELLRLDLEFRWDRGENRRVEDYAGRFPALFADPSLLAAVAGEEYRQRKAAGEAPDLSEYKDRLRIDLNGSGGDFTPVLEPGPVWGGKEFPRLGEFIPPGFLIRSELGRGAFGRVYLAEQADLAGRLVAVKISSRLIGEAQTLARLQHTHIVPVYAVHRVGSYQLLVMPFLGSATLADLVTAIRGSGSVPATGQAILTAISSRAGEVPAAPEPAPGPAAPAQAEALVRVPYADAILDFGITIADGLAHAHQRGILHRDLKPANVLLTDDGQPMLLDFNLAADDRSVTRTVGGTPRYMAPEQLAALGDPAVRVDGRADVYALGLLLHELLTGRLPFAGPADPTAETVGAIGAARRNAPHIELASPGVAAILRQCLAPDPADRYATAADLRDDLTRHRTDQPLAHVPEPLSRERARKWARRHPRLASGTSVALVAAILLAGVGGAAYSTWRNKVDVQAREDRGVLRRAVDYARYHAFDPSTAGRHWDRVREQSLAALKRYETTEPADWRNTPAVRRLPSDEAEGTGPELAELLFHAAQSAQELADRQADADARRRLADEAVFLNERARRMGVASEALQIVLDRQHARLHGEPWERSRDVVFGPDLRLGSNPRTGDRFLLALAEFRDRRFSEAAAILEDAVARDRTYEAWVALGATRLRLHQYDQAADAYLAAMALEPGADPPLLHRGTAFVAAGRWPAAVDILGRFIDRIPTEPDAWLNRAIARFHLEAYDDALADLAEAERLGESVTRVRGVRLQVYRARNAAAKADAEYKALLAAIPETPVDWTIRAEARLATDPAGAIHDFDAALKIEPDYLPALRGKASCLSEGLGRPTDALKVLDRVVAMEGAVVEDRSGHAVLLARLGLKSDARRRARDCLGPETPPLPLYQAASALALTAETAGDRAEVVRLLKRVLKGDVAWAKHMPGDPDLKAVHADPAFKAITAAAAVLDLPDRK